jgi:deazaflavin-dependent oxidoreductase (nitroreductase family)
LFARVLHRIDRIAFGLSGGRRTVTSTQSGLPVIMLTTTGARTGLPRTVPVLGFPIKGDIAIAGGNFGRRQDPAWCLNLRRDPNARIVIDGHVRKVVAEELAGEAREAVWQHCLAIYPGGTAYAAHAGTRTIGVFLLRSDSG